MVEWKWTYGDKAASLIPTKRTQYNLGFISVEVILKLKNGISKERL